MTRTCSETLRLLVFAIFMLLPAGAFAEGAEPQQEAVAGVTGTVVDSEERPIEGAVVLLFGPNRLLLRQQVTAGDGSFTLAPVPPGNYELRVSSPPFRDRVRLVDVGRENVTVQIRFAPAEVQESVTVTASRGILQEDFAVAGTVRSLGIEKLEERAPDIVPRMVDEETGVIAQQTTPGQGSPILRGQGAQAVLYAVDGVRYNNATYRAGNTQYLAWIPSSNMDGLDVQLGPASVNFGSDALGGAININTAQVPNFRVDPSWGWSGELRGFGESATGNLGGSAMLGGASQSFATLFTFVGAHNAELRGGRGQDSHNAFVRWFGLSQEQVQDLLGTRMDQTDYGFTGFSGKASWRPGEHNSVTGMYMRNDQYDVRRYDRLLGGDGRYIAAFTPQTLDFGYLRYQDVMADDVFIEATFSVNRQNDGRLDQRYSDRDLTTEGNDVTAFGYEFLASTGIGNHMISGGAELYDEYVDSFRTETDAAGTVTPVRPRVPDGSRYDSFGAFILDEWAIIPDRLHLTGGLRYSYFNARIKGAQISEDDFQAAAKETANDLTYNIGASFWFTPEASIYFRTARGFRAPSIYDFSEQGLTGGGFEVPPSEAVAFDSLVGDSASVAAVSTGVPWATLQPELLYSYEGGFRWGSERTRVEVAVFYSELSDNIVRRTLIVPTDVVGQTIAGQTIVAQDEAGRIYVPVDTRPIVSRSNSGLQDVYGVEWMFQQGIGRDWRLIGKGSVQRGNELDTGNYAPKIAPDNVYLILHWTQPGGRLWLEALFTGMLPQDRLNPGELDDARIGAYRDAGGIANFFNHGATDMGLVEDGIFLPTGETLEQIQLRVLGPGLVGNSLFTETRGWWSLSLRGRYAFSPDNELMFGIGNMFDRNYRLHGSGFDAPGFNAHASWVLGF
jgi:outer membrane receptor protein involved in Fe transport